MAAAGEAEQKIDQCDLPPPHSDAPLWAMILNGALSWGDMGESCSLCGRLIGFRLAGILVSAPHMSAPHNRLFTTYPSRVTPRNATG